MKRTTIGVEDALLRDLKELARQRHTSVASIIRDALAAHVVRHSGNPRVRLAGLGASTEPTDTSNGKDEAILRRHFTGLQPVGDR